MKEQNIYRIIQDYNRMVQRTGDLEIALSIYAGSEDPLIMDLRDDIKRMKDRRKDVESVLRETYIEVPDFFNRMWDESEEV